MARTPSSNNRRGAVRKRPTSGNSGSDRLSPWRWYGAGVLTGVFLSLLLYLGALPPATPPAVEPEAAGKADKNPAPSRPRFDFYTVLPEQTIDVEVEPATVSQPRESTAPATWLLQAGSFRQREDADRRRAELLLLGLEPRVEESPDSGTGRWFRVYLGPFDSRSEVSRVRGLTAGQDIDTLLLKRGQP
ncbi:SPOR domain-containing protein [Haliea atlantica]